jgi:hypothetical protein
MMFSSCRELQDLKSGAVTSVTLVDGSGEVPVTGCLVIIQFKVLAGRADVNAVRTVASALCEENLHASVLNEGLRMPRAWELVLLGVLASSCTLQ